jgi:hypothetical protein
VVAQMQGESVLKVGVVFVGDFFEFLLVLVVALLQPVLC